jgi:hypothetical protein
MDELSLPAEEVMLEMSRKPDSICYPVIGTLVSGDNGRPNA